MSSDRPDGAVSALVEQRPRAVGPMRVRRRLRIARWPTPDWEYTYWGYRAIKFNAERAVRWAARINARGAENVPLQGGVILAVNHFSWADPIVLGAVIPRPAFYLAKEKLFRNPLMRGFLGAMGQVKVDRERGGNDAAIEQSVELVDAGFVVGVFPEGTRSRYGELKRGKTGVARIALLTGAPVVPVALSTHEFWPKHSTLPKFGRKVYINIGRPMFFKGGPDLARDRQVTRDMTDDIMGRIRELLNEADSARERDEPWA